MNVPKAFWIALAACQVAFGTAVFLVTRSYYRDHESVARIPPAQLHSLDFRAPIDVPPSVDTDRPRSAEELAELADSHFGDGQYEAALALYEQLLTQDPFNVDLLNNLGLTLHYVGRSPEALRHLEQGIAVDRGHQRIRLTYGFVLSQLGRADEAVAALEAAIRLNEASEVAESARRMIAETTQP